MRNRSIAKISIVLGSISLLLGVYVQTMTAAGVQGGFIPVVCGALAICGGLLIWNRR